MEGDVAWPPKDEELGSWVVQPTTHVALAKRL